MIRGEDGIWKLEIALEAGTYGYKFVRNEDEWVLDPENDQILEIDGVENSRLIVELAPVITEKRIWTEAASGRELEAIIKEFDGKIIGLETASGKKYKLDVSVLSKADRTYAARWKAGQNAEKAPAAEVALGNAEWAKNLVPGGEPVRWRVDVPAIPKKTLGGGFPDNRKGPFQIEIRVSIPEGFDPGAKDHWIGLVSATASGNTKSCDAMDMYWQHCTANGLACVAVDVVAEGDELRVWAGTDTRWSLFILGLEEMSKTWPGMQQWTWVPMGFSGGGGYTMYFGALMDKMKWDCGGLLSNASGHTDHFTSYFRPRSSYYRTIPNYMSFGKNNDALKQSAQESCIAWAKRELKIFRYAKFDGGHECHPPHVDEALKWFKQVRAERKE